jgi:starch synthase
MIAMRYGCVPIVRAVGGLHDTVTDSETGFAFVDAKVKSFNDALRRALALIPYHSRWMNMQKAGMALDFSWQSSAQKYGVLYKKMVDEMKVSPARDPHPKPKEPAGRRIREEEARVETGNAEG